MILFKILVVVAMVIILKSVTDYFNMQSQLWLVYLTVQLQTLQLQTLQLCDSNPIIIIGRTYMVS